MFLFLQRAGVPDDVWKMMLLMMMTTGEVLPTVRALSNNNSDDKNFKCENRNSKNPNGGTPGV